MQYTQEDKKIIEEFLKAKRSFSLKSETHVERGLTADTGSLSPSFFSLPLPFCLFLSFRDSLSLSSHTPFHGCIYHAVKPLLSFTRHMSHEELFLWLCDHPRLMGVDYRHDIGKLKGMH